MLSGFWIFGAILIALALVLIVLWIVGLTRASNVRNRADIVGKTNVPRDPTESRQATDIADTGATGGNYSRSVPYKQDAGMGTGKADQMTTSDRQ